MQIVENDVLLKVEFEVEDVAAAMPADFLIIGVHQLLRADAILPELVQEVVIKPLGRAAQNVKTRKTDAARQKKAIRRPRESPCFSSRKPGEIVVIDEATC